MKIFVCASKHFYPQAKSIIEKLQGLGHTVTPPNSFDDPGQESRMQAREADEYIKWKANMFLESINHAKRNDAILVLNFEKEGKKNYIGGATFLEIFKAWELGKKVFLYNPIPEGMLADELVGMNPVILNGNLDGIR